MPEDMIKNLKPSTSTVASASIGTAASTVILWVLSEYANINPPPEVAAAAGALIAAIIGYFFWGGKSEETV